MQQGMLRKIAQYLRHEAGVAAIVLALSLPMLVASVGVGVDLATAYNAKNRLSNALDKATLAAASTNGTDDEVRARMLAFFNANYPPDRFGTPHDIDLNISGSVLTVTASTSVPTKFMGLFGLDDIDVHAESQVVRELAGVEAVLVLDVTGSMAGNNISALKTASTNFINTMFDKIEDPQYLRIGIVPWSNAVNVGPYGKGLNLTGGVYGTPFVDNPATDSYISPASNITYGSGNYDWQGCVIERSSSSALLDQASPNWQMYRYPPNKCSLYNCTQYNCAQYNCAQYNCAQYNCTQYNCALYNCTKTDKNGNCTKYGSTCVQYGTTCTKYGNTCVQYGTTCKTYGNTCQQYGNTCTKYGNTCVQWSGDPNTDCPSSPIQPLINDQKKLLSIIGGLQVGGNTYSNIGMVWGWRVISEDFPFSEGSPYDDKRWSKTVILMTDGDNTINSTYSGEGPYGTTGTSTTATQQNQKFAQICTNMKAKGIRVYTITFQSAINSTTKGYYRNCATSPTMYYDAPSNQSLINAFDEIANQLSQLHITK